MSFPPGWWNKLAGSGLALSASGRSPEAAAASRAEGKRSNMYWYGTVRTVLHVGGFCSALLCSALLCFAFAVCRPGRGRIAVDQPLGHVDAIAAGTCWFIWSPQGTFDTHTG
ncbi:hypothetical protein LX36DRAFT_405951 [Colletotrichum falcatum]|nr:hypothetical protein LX36DRAFT_405951 [Colletotrichum falcatum]